MDIQTTIENKIKKLPPDLLNKLDLLIDDLIHNSEKDKDKNKELTFSWRGGLSDIKMNSVELQKKAMDIISS